MLSSCINTKSVQCDTSVALLSVLYKMVYKDNTKCSAIVRDFNLPSIWKHTVSCMVILTVWPQYWPSRHKNRNQNSYWCHITHSPSLSVCAGGGRHIYTLLDEKNYHAFHTNLAHKITATFGLITLTGVQCFQTVWLWCDGVIKLQVVSGIGWLSGVGYVCVWAWGHRQ